MFATPSTPRHRFAIADRGFTLIELLVAMAITLLLAGALAGVVRPARDAFARVPAELDLQQRARTALDTISQAIRSADGYVVLSEPDESGWSAELTAIVPVAGGAQGVLAVDQVVPDALLTLDVAPCPNVKEICGFAAGNAARIVDDAGKFDVFTIAAVNPGARWLTPAAALSQAYGAGSAVIRVDQYTFRLDPQPDESESLVRETAAGAVQPIVDDVEGLWFRLSGDRVVTSMGFAGRVFTASSRLGAAR